MNRNKYRNSHIKTEALRELRRLRDEIVEAMPAGKVKAELQAKAKARTDMDEWRDATSTIARSARRFATGIYCLWYPAKARGTVEAAVGELLHSGITRLLQVELDIGVAPNEPSRAEGQGPRLSATGLLVVNAPFGFAEAIEETLATLTTIFARGAGANGFVRRRGRES